VWAHPTQGYYYANGVALSQDDSFVVMAETDRIRAHKIWLRGPKVSPVCLSVTLLGCHAQVVLGAGGVQPVQPQSMLSGPCSP
jgi:hypothetical protein